GPHALNSDQVQHRRRLTASSIHWRQNPASIYFRRQNPASLLAPPAPVSPATAAPSANARSRYGAVPRGRHPNRCPLPIGLNLVKPRLTLFCGQTAVFASLFLVPRGRHPLSSHALLEPAGRLPEPLDQGLGAFHGGEPRFHVPQPA